MESKGLDLDSLISEIDEIKPVVELTGKNEIKIPKVAVVDTVISAVIPEQKLEEQPVGEVIVEEEPRLIIPGVVKPEQNNIVSEIDSVSIQKNTAVVLNESEVKVEPMDEVNSVESQVVQKETSVAPVSTVAEVQQSKLMPIDAVTNSVSKNMSVNNSVSDQIISE
jgi:hypothetical protein